MTILLRGGRVVDPSQRLDGVRDVLLRDGSIGEIAESIQVGSEVEVIDVAGKVVAPGFIDIHVHLREPGQEHKETVETGTRAAAGASATGGARTWEGPMVGEASDSCGGTGSEVP